MKYLKIDPATLGAEDAKDVQISSEVLEQKLVEVKTQLAQETDSIKRATLFLDLGGIYLDLQKEVEAWKMGQQAFKVFISVENWEYAVLACDLMFGADQPDSLVALGNGVWLAVTFPIEPELSIAMLEHIVDETPNDSDGGAVAAAAACYIADFRTTDNDRENLLFFSNQLLAKVGRRHGNISTQVEFEAWVKKLELDSPNDFLGRLSQVLEVMVQDDWWIDRDALRDKLPKD